MVYCSFLDSDVYAYRNESGVWICHCDHKVSVHIYSIDEIIKHMEVHVSDGIYIGNAIELLQEERLSCPEIKNHLANDGDGDLVYAAWRWLVWLKNGLKIEKVDSLVKLGVLHPDMTLDEVRAVLTSKDRSQ